MSRAVVLAVAALRVMSDERLAELAQALDHDTAMALWRELTVRVDAEFDQDHRETPRELAFVPPF